jgi:thioredoxin 2
VCTFVPQGRGNALKSPLERNADVAPEHSRLAGLLKAQETADTKWRLSCYSLIVMESTQIRCSECGAMNRVPGEKLQQGLKAVCGRCKAPLVAAGKPISVSDATFHTEIELSPLPVLLDMWAPWCGPCRMVGPVVEALAVELTGRVRVAKMDVDQNPATAARFNIQSIPALLVFKGGREVGRIVGAQPKSEILRNLERLIA